MDEQMIALGRRAVACKGWRWPKDRAPMLAKFAEGDWEETSDWLHRLKQNSEGDWVLRSGVVVVPNLSHPFMVGWLLALVREAWSDPTISVQPDNTGCGWWLNSLTAELPGTIFGSEAEALVAALEAAP